MMDFGCHSHYWNISQLLQPFSQELPRREGGWWTPHAVIWQQGVGMLCRDDANSGFRKPIHPSPFDKLPSPSRSTRNFIHVSPTRPVHRNSSPSSPGPSNCCKTFVQPSPKSSSRMKIFETFLFSLFAPENRYFLLQLTFEMEGTDVHEKNERN